MAYRLDRPPIPRSIDNLIASQNGDTVALDATRKKLETHKIPTAPSLKEIIETRTREVGRLREELAYLHDVEKLGETLREELEYILGRLRLAVMNFQTGQRQINQARGIPSKEFADTV